MLVGQTQYTLTPKKKPYGELSSNRLPFFHERQNQQFNKDINERPFKYNSNELTFKGLSFYGNNNDKKETEKENKKKSIAETFKKNPTFAVLGAVIAAGVAMAFMPKYKDAGSYSISAFKEFSKKHLGNIGNDLLEHLEKNPLAKDQIKIDGDKIHFKQKTTYRLIWDGLKYPFTILPADILNGIVGGMRKIKPLKNWAENKYNSQFFKNIRQRSKIDAKMNALRGLFKKHADLTQQIPAKDGKPARFRTAAEISDEMYRASVKMFDPKTGNYDTKHERALNRLVSGLPPAIFLANDAYNLSRMMDDDDKAATKEKKTRFKQETARILTSGYLTLITMGALQKFINNSKAGIMLMTGSTVLVTEMFSRLANGKHIKRLTPEEAREENRRNNAQEAKIKPTQSFTAEMKPSDTKDDKEKQQKPLLSFSTIMKASGVVLAAGYATKGLRKIQAVEDAFTAFKKPFKDLFRRLTVDEHHTISTETFNKIVKTLDENGYSELSRKYKEVAKDLTKGDKIELGAKDKKIKPLVKFVIAPFKFAWNAVTMPYWVIEEKLLPAIIKGYGAKKISAGGNKNMEALAKSIDSIGQQALKKNFNKQEFQTYVNDNILKAFNVDTMSNVSNSDLSNLAKFSATAATLWFLMTDNYNMVMLKSNGNDVEGAKTKFKERFVQEGSRFFYQTLLIDLFNSTFSKQYNGSLGGMSWITLTNTTLGEILTRKSVGTPIGKHTRQELEDIETAQNNSTGFKKKYYTFMKRLTGKRSIQSYSVEKRVNNSSTAQTQPQPQTEKSETPAFMQTTEDNVFKKMIKG